MDALLRANGRPLWLFGKGDEFWLVWEVAAIIGALAGTLVFWLVQYAVPPHLHEQMHRGWVKGLSPILILMTLVMFVLAAVAALNHWDIRGHLGFLCIGVFGFVAIQVLFLWDTANPPNNGRKKPGVEQAREDFRGALLYSDLPALGSFVTLFLVVCFLCGCENIDPQRLRAFVGGIVAFELVTTTAVFVIEYWYTPKRLAASDIIKWFGRVLE